MCSIWTLPTFGWMSEWLPAWWALWLPWWPPAGCNNALMYLLIFTMNFCYCFIVVFCWKWNLLLLNKWNDGWVEGWMKWIDYLIHWIINWLIYQLLSLNELWNMHFSEKRITNKHLTNGRKYPYQYWVCDKKFSNESFLNTHLPNWRKCIIDMWYALVFQGRLTVIFESIMERNHIMCELFSVKGGISKHIGIHSEEEPF